MSSTVSVIHEGIAVISRTEHSRCIWAICPTPESALSSLLSPILSAQRGRLHSEEPRVVLILHQAHIRHLMIHHVIICPIFINGSLWSSDVYHATSSSCDIYYTINYLGITLLLPSLRECFHVYVSSSFQHT